MPDAPEIPAEAERLTPQQVIANVLGSIEGEGLNEPGAMSLASDVILGLRFDGLVIVRAEDINAVLGPAPGADAYIASGRRLLEAVEPPGIEDRPTPCQDTPSPAQSALANQHASSHPSEHVRCVICGHPTGRGKVCGSCRAVPDVLDAAVERAEQALEQATRTLDALTRATARREHYAHRAWQAEAAITRVRRLCEMTINVSCRVQAIDQARDTLAALDCPDAQQALVNALLNAMCDEWTANRCGNCEVVNTPQPISEEPTP